MKTLIIIFLFPLQIAAQDITGLWTGFIHTAEKDLPYELAISESNGKLIGYSHTTFTVNGIPETGVKAVTVDSKNGKVSVEDEALLFNDFSEAPAKGVRQFDFLTLVVKDTVMMLNGTFKTNKTKVYRSVSGSIELKKIDTSKRNKIIPKLNELNLLSTLSFLQPKLNDKEAIVIAPVTQVKNAPVQPANAKADTTALAKVISPVSKPQLSAAALKLPPQTQDKPQVTATLKPVEKQTAQVPVVTKKPPSLPLPKEKAKPVAAAAPKPVEVKKTPVIAATKPPDIRVVQTPKAQINPLPQVINVISAAEIAKRKTETIQSIDFKSDSLLITLYDNGEVDGDTVSVLLNGKVILANQGLTTNAITKTIYVTPELGDSLQLVMYAENLGSIPPNTGLLILQDGKDRYEVRFAGDFQKNSAVLLRRRHD